MSWLDNSHWILATLVSLLWLAGFSFLIFKPGKKYASWISWIPVALLGLFIVGLGVDLFLIHRDLGGAQKLWARGWIGPHDQEGAITIGVLEDTIGLTAALVSAFLALILCSNQWIARREQNSERIHAGLLMGVSGISIAWLSLTPWLSLLGISVAALGGFVMLGAQGDAELMEIFGIEKTAGFVLSLTGAAVLAGGRGALSLEKNFILASTAIPHGYDVLGGVLLFLGLFVQAQPVPFLGWLIRAPRISSVSSTVGAQIFPALAALGLVIRFEPELRALGAFPVFQWLAVSSAILTAFCGLAQENWKTAMPMWLSSSFSLVFAALCFSGPAVAFPIFLGSVISATAISLLASAREAGIFSVKTRSWFRPLLGFAAAGAVGFVGFVSSGALARLLSQSARNPADAVALALTLLFVQLLFWKAFFSVWTTPGPKNETLAAHSVAPVASAAVLLLVGLGLIWTGDATGGVIPHDVDRLFPSWFSVIFGSASGDWGDESTLALGQGLLWAAVALAGGLGLWFFSSGQDVLASFFEGSPKLRDFLVSGFRVDRVGSLVLQAIRATGNFAENRIGEKVSIQWVPKAIEQAFRFPARWLDKADREIYAREESLLRKWVEVPAKALQLIQNGDLQWYLVFGIGTMIALLVHFVRA